MSLTHWITVFILATGLAACSSKPTNSELEGMNWKPIFDGKTLDGWVPKIVGQGPGEDSGKIFRVLDGAIHVSYENYSEFQGRFGHLFYDQDLSDYRLRLEYKFYGRQLTGGPGWANANSGVMLHAQAADTMSLEQAFPVSLEAQLLGLIDQEPNRTTASVCTPGTHIVIANELVTRHCTSSELRSEPMDQWVRLEIEVRNHELIVFSINGEEAMRLAEPQFDINSNDATRLNASGPLGNGYIALQAESHPVAFRNIELMLLPDEER